MSTYTELKGLKVKYLAANPDPGTAGDVWYDSATYQLKGFVGRSAWSSEAHQIDSLFRRGSAGTSTASFLAGGDSAPAPSVTNKTEEWSGTGFSAGGNINTARYSLAAAGTQTAGLIFGGDVSPGGYKDECESYDGSSWTEVADLNTARFVTMGVGTSTAALCFGGLKSPSNALSNNSEEWDGSSWTAGNAMNTARESTGQAGIQTAALAYGGYTTTTVTTTESYDGTNWTAGTAINTARFTLGGAGIQTAALAFGGDTSAPAMSAHTELYDGSTWTEVADLSTARFHLNEFGPGTTNAFAAGGGTPGVTGVTEEFNQTAMTVTAGAWASGNNMNTARYQMAGAGTLTAGLAFGGYTTTAVGVTEEYDGTNWTESGDLGTARYEQANGSGTQTAALCVAGRAGGTRMTNVEEYNGSTWSEVTDVPGSAKSSQGSAGPQTAAIAALGATPANSNAAVVSSFEYDGTNWTAGGDANTARTAAFATGTQTAAIFAGGGPVLTNAEEYDGSSFSTTGSLLFGAQGPFASGIQTSALYASGGNGGTGSGTAETQGYNGSVFATQPTLASERGYGAGFGTAAASVAGGGLRSSGVATTEEFTGESTALNLKTITDS